MRQKVKDLIDAGTRKLIVEFSDVPYIDSTGLGFLAGARVTVQNAGARLVLANLSPHVRKILDDVNLAQFFVIAGSEAAAMALLSQPSAADTYRYWPLQWYETGMFVGLALILAGFCFWWLRRRYA